MHREKTPLKRLCDVRGIKYGWFASQLGMSHGHFAHIEAGRRVPPPDYYEKAARILGVPEDMLRPEKRDAA